MLSWVPYTRKRQHSNLQSEANSASFQSEWVTPGVTARWFIAWLFREVLTSPRFPSLAWGPPALRIEINYSTGVRTIGWETHIIYLKIVLLFLQLTEFYFRSLSPHLLFFYVANTVVTRRHYSRKHTRKSSGFIKFLQVKNKHTTKRLNIKYNNVPGVGGVEPRELAPLSFPTPPRLLEDEVLEE